MAKKIKVFHISEDFSYIGGVERYLWYLAKNLDREKFELSFVCVGNKHGPMGGKIEKLGWPVYGLNHKVLYDNLSSCLNLSITFKLIKLIKNYQPDIVQTWDIDGNFFGRIAAILAGTPKLVATEVSRWDMREGFINKLSSTIVKFFNIILDLSTDVIIVNSKDIEGFRSNLVASRKIQLIYHPFDSGVFLKAGLIYRATKAHNKDGFVLGVVSRLASQKGHKFLLQAMTEVTRRFPNTKLLIVGSGPLEKELRVQIQSLHISKNVIFKGEITNKVPEIMASLDVLIQPSLYEGGGPTTVLEAMAIGLPVVGTRVGGMPESIINGKTGFLVPPKDPQALAKAIIKLLANEKRAKAMGAEGRRTILKGRYLLPTYLKNMKSLYMRLTKSL